jgi:hypothetical protein
LQMPDFSDLLLKVPIPAAKIAVSNWRSRSIVVCQLKRRFNWGELSRCRCHRVVD